LVYQYVKKGQRVYVTGRLTYGEITDTEGVQRATTAIIAEDVIFMSSGKSSSS
jgi:single-strand DNA-binding protein